MMKPEQVKGHIAEIEGKLQKLAQDHQAGVNQFNAFVTNNQATFNQLNGQLSAYRAMLGKPKEAKHKK